MHLISHVRVTWSKWALRWYCKVCQFDPTYPLALAGLLVAQYVCATLCAAPMSAAETAAIPAREDGVEAPGGANGLGSASKRRNLDESDSNSYALWMRQPKPSSLVAFVADWLSIEFMAMVDVASRDDNTMSDWMDEDKMTPRRPPCVRRLMRDVNELKLFP